MDKTSIIATLEAIGIEKKAASLYATLLSNKRLGVAELARQADVKRATCYEHLEVLLKNNFVMRVPVGKRMYYAAVHPKKVLATYKRKAHEFETKLEAMVTLHEEAVNKPRVTFFEGKQELNNIYENLFRSMGDSYSIFPPDAFFSNFTEDEYLNFDKTNSAHAMKTKDLFVSSKHTKRLRELRTNKGFDNKSDKELPEWFTTNVDVLVFSDTVALISLRDLSAIVIENKDIAELFKNIHTFMWKYS